MIESNLDKILNILWESLEGGDYDLEALRGSLNEDSDFEDVGLDSLDMSDFFLRLQDHYQISIRQEDYAQLSSLGSVKSYLKQGTVGVS